MARSRSDEPLVLRATASACRVRTWAHDPSVAQLVLYNQRLLPTAAEMTRWLEEIARHGYTCVRTGAMNRVQVALVEPLGFQVMQELALLEHIAPADHAATSAASARTTHRLTPDRFAAASLVDCAAFPAPWGLDAVTIDDVCHATARHRARRTAPPDDDHGVNGFAISGRDGRLGFLQRLAVDPAHQGHGLGSALVADCLRWMARRRVGRVLVNTHVDNAAALSLYRRHGFARLPERLSVLEKSLV